MVHHTTEKTSTESSHGKTSFSARIQNDRHYTGDNIHMDLVLEVKDLEIRFMCHFTLNVG